MSGMGFSGWTVGGGRVGGVRVFWVGWDNVFWAEKGGRGRGRGRAVTCGWNVGGARTGSLGGQVWAGFVHDGQGVGASYGLGGER